MMKMSFLQKSATENDFKPAVAKKIKEIRKEYMDRSNQGRRGEGGGGRRGGGEREREREAQKSRKQARKKETAVMIYAMPYSC